MAREWRPSPWARLFIRSGDWAIRVDRERIAIRCGGDVVTTPLTGESLRLRRGRVWNDIVLPGGDQILTGLSRRDRATLENEIGVRLLERMCTEWSAAFGRSVADRVRHRRWMAERFIGDWDRTRMALVRDKEASFQALRGRARRGGLDETAAAAVHAVHTPSSVRDAVDDENEAIFRAELKAERHFLRSIEKTPLTREQARSVITFDNRVQLVAAAGSGKTSTMVAKAAWAVHKGIARPDEVLMLAFNQAAAQELEQRTTERFRAAGLSGTVRAMTFHAFGLRVIGEATGRKPSVSESVVSDEGTSLMTTLIAQLAASDPAFAAAWRIVGDGSEQLVRTALSHAKSNDLSDAQLRERARATEDLELAEAFVTVLTAVRAAWDAHLRAEGSVDFDDMLNQSAELIESGRWSSPYRVVLVDEFQDVSRARARLVNALQNGGERHLFAVGDDWQSIYRFAGSDITAMTRFEDMFGLAQVLKLTRTFRSGAELSRAAGRFVMKNPEQIRKTVRSTLSHPDPIALEFVAGSGDAREAIARHLAQIAARLGPDDTATVKILGRFRRDEQFLPDTADDRLTIEFQTMHASKGLEADHVILPAMNQGGFPSTREEDALLRLVLPSGDAFPFAEERRLFYVALTRARKSVLLVADENRPSEFAMELLADGVVTANRDVHVCVQCRRGVLARRRGASGDFLGCSRFPACRHTEEHARVAT
ncbi:UvrD-helicase domain-containing protein [Microbacterium amylolyticum]|uniref:DNA 3'-5' helicase n=1 Tax=Microbacterium amylolyticum TaxID=936337 RepID=A0ABS4ZJ84_9MICO|nr:UvrD-helicase domain-containing protein [Microbacterium amylolyticum]MBP2437352.1 DNA helicase-4 [Microbacterium amylolyticum]